MSELASVRGILLPKAIEKNPSYASRLSVTIITVTAAIIFALIPLFVNPYNVDYQSLSFERSFVPPKFELLLVLSGLLLAVMLAAWLSGAKFRRVPMLIPAGAFLAISALSTALQRTHTSVW